MLISLAFLIFISVHDVRGGIGNGIGNMGRKLSQIFSGRMGGGSVGLGFRFLTRFADLFLAPFVLQAPVLFAYLAARGWTLIMPLALYLLGRKVAPQMMTLVQRDAQMPFRAAAARVELEPSVKRIFTRCSSSSSGRKSPMRALAAGCRENLFSEFSHCHLRS